MYLNSLEVGQQHILALLLTQNCFLFLSQPGLHELQHVSLFTEALNVTLKEQRFTFIEHSRI